MAEQREGLERAIPSERARLVRLCARLTGSRDAAEDLAQETLYEAWRQVYKLHQQEGQAQWLSAIARNVCLRWVSKQRREVIRFDSRDRGDVIPDASPDEWPAEGIDLDVELERDELAALLDRALALLPAPTRAVLVERYIQESPHAEIAARLGLSEGAVKVKLHRGKLALRRILTTDLRGEAAAYGLVGSDSQARQETRIWCPYCGQRRLLGRFTKDGDTGGFHLQCPQCCSVYGWRLSVTNISFADFPGAAALLGDVKGYKAALSRVMAWADSYYRRRSSIYHRLVPCLKCGRATALRLDLPPDWPPSLRDLCGLHARCDHCGMTPSESLTGLVLCLPEGRRFWREHQRIRALPTREIAVAGRPAFVTSFESLGSVARLDVLSARDTYALLGVHGTPGG